MCLNIIWEKYLNTDASQCWVSTTSPLLKAKVKPHFRQRLPRRLHWLAGHFLLMFITQSSCHDNSCHDNQPPYLCLVIEQRDHGEHPALLRSSCFLLQTVLNPFFPSFSSVTSEVQSAGYYLSGKQLSCHFLKLWVCNNSVCSGKRGQVWDRSWC